MSVSQSCPHSFLGIFPFNTYFPGFLEVGISRLIYRAVTVITLITVLTFTDLMLKPVLVAAASLIEGYPFHSFVCLWQSCREEYHAAALRLFLSW